MLISNRYITRIHIFDDTNALYFWWYGNFAYSMRHINTHFNTREWHKIKFDGDNICLECTLCRHRYLQRIFNFGGLENEIGQQELGKISIRLYYSNISIEGS